MPLPKCSEVRTLSQESISTKPNSLYDQGLRAVGTSWFPLHATQISIVCSPGKDTFCVTKNKNSEKTYIYLSIIIITFCCALWPPHNYSTEKQRNKQKAIQWLVMSLAFSILPVWVDPTVHGHCGHGELLLALVKEQCWSGTSAGCMAGWWCRQVSAAKKSCHCSEKEWPYLCTLIFFWIIVTHVAARQQLAVHKVTGSQQGWGWLAPLEMASSSPLLRARPQQEQGYSSFLGAT